MLSTPRLLSSGIATITELLIQNHSRDLGRGHPPASQPIRASNLLILWESLGSVPSLRVFSRTRAESCELTSFVRQADLVE